MREKLTITKNPKEILEKIVEIHGIDIVRQFIKDYNKQNRKKQIRGNNYIDIAYDVYKLMFKNGYSKTRAISRVSIDKNISENTVRNHCYNFDKEAKKEDYYSFGYVVEDRYNQDQSYDYTIDEAIEDTAHKNNIHHKKAMIFYFKYKLYNKPDKPKINEWKFNGQDIPF